MDPKKSEKVERVINPQEDQTKKPYEEPRIVSSEPLEAMASACLQQGGKAPGVCTLLTNS